jgi:hypothetical protein
VIKLRKGIRMKNLAQPWSMKSVKENTLGELAVDGRIKMV